MSAIATMFASVQNRLCIVDQVKGAEPKKFRLFALSDKIGTLKSGEKAPYVILQSEDDKAIVINLHPEHAKRLFKKGEDSGIKMMEEDNGAAEEVVVAPEVVVTEQPTTSVTESQQQADAPAGEDAAPVAEQPTSKKARATAIFNANVGKARKDVIAIFKDQLGMSDPGAATYYHNIKSGLWK